MSGRSRASQSQPPDTTSTTTASAPGTVEPQAGNAAAAEGLGPGGVAGQLPSSVDLQELGVNFSIPGGTVLKGGWNPLGTSGGTTVFVRLSASKLEISFSPPLVVDATWPMSNVEWSGVVYDFATGSVSKTHLRNTQWLAFGTSGFVDDAIREFVTGAVAGTALARGGYNPFTDPDPMATLGQLQANIAAGGGGGPAPLGAGDLTKITPTATVALREEVRQGTDQGGIHIAAGTSLTLYAELGGTGQDLATSGVQSVSSLWLSTPGVELTSNGAPIALLKELEVDHGGAVKVHRFEGLGKLKEAQGVESGIKALIALLQIAAIREGGGGGMTQEGLVTNLDPTVVNTIATSELEKALSTALHDVIVQHHDAIPGVDLQSVLGVK